jgi:hypothetical protein
MPKARPADFASVVRQTSHPLNADLLHAFAFIENPGDALNIKDHIGSADKSLVDNGGGGWDAVNGLDVAHNHPSDSTHALDTDFTYPDQSSFTILMGIEVTEQDTVSTSRPSALLHSDVSTSFTGAENNVGIMLLQDSQLPVGQTGNLVFNVGGSSGRRRVEDVPYIAGTTGLVNLALTYDYSGNSDAGLITAQVGATQYAENAGSGARPNNSGAGNGLPSGANLAKAQDAASTGGFNGTYLYKYIYGRALSQTEINSVFNDIWAPISAVDAGGGGGSILPIIQHYRNQE